MRRRSTFPRVVVQLSTFTIHPRPRPGETIVDLLPNEEHLVRYVVPGDNKRKLRTDLAALGITRTALFQDLDSLSKTIVDELKASEYHSHHPPHCGGALESPTQPAKE